MDNAANNAGWFAFAIFAIPVFLKFAYDVWNKKSENRISNDNAVIAGHKELLKMTNDTLADVTKELKLEREAHEEERNAHAECKRRVDRLSIKMEWVVAELKRQGCTIPPWVLADGSERHLPIAEGPK